MSDLKEKIIKEVQDAKNFKKKSKIRYKKYN